MEKEIWRDIPGYEERYKISNTWLVYCKWFLKWSVTQKWKFMKLRTDLYWYKEAKLSKDKKQKIYRVNRLVWFTFMGWNIWYYNPKEKTIVCHKNNIRDDNRLENLYIGTQKENIQQAKKENRIKNNFRDKKASMKDRTLMLLIYKTGKYTKKQVSERFWYHQTFLWKLIKGIL